MAASSPSLEVEIVKEAGPDVELHVVPATVEEVAAGEQVPAHLRVAGFEGKVAETVFDGGTLYVGVGHAAGVDADVIRRASAAVARAGGRVRRMAVPLHPDFAQAEAEGLLAGSYRFGVYRTGGERALTHVELVGSGAARVRADVSAGQRIGEAVNLARDLVNEPGGALTATVFASRIAALAKQTGLTAEVLDPKAIRAAGHAGLLAVNQGSKEPARFVELTYDPPGARRTVALVGKGITFDSGGLSIKPADGMISMKSDMGGAAAVVAAMSACADLGVKVRVRGFLPLTDNMTGGDAQRVGDIIRYANGRTVEVLNTDAEGRLVLADALLAASAEAPAAIIDLATLTGAQVVALGTKVAALFASDDALAERLSTAAAAAGEPMWRLPLVETYRRDIDSKVADLRNVAAHRNGGAIMAALFLREFVAEGTPWAHLDIAGPAFTDSEDAGQPAGGTGFGVRTLLAALRAWR